jgi:hypothetical protein
MGTSGCLQFGIIMKKKKCFHERWWVGFLYPDGWGWVNEGWGFLASVLTCGPISFLRGEQPLVLAAWFPVFHSLTLNT